MNTIFDKLNTIGSSFTYWLALLLLGISLEGVALYFQYGLGYAPCMLCIHVRIWVVGLIFVALLAQWLRRRCRLNPLAHLLVVGVMVGMFERAWQLVGTERGTIEGACSLDLGLPAWFALDKWLPAIFEVRDFCGYTPKLLFGITMAESLFVFSAVVALIATIFAVVSLMRCLPVPKTHHRN